MLNETFLKSHVAPAAIAAVIGIVGAVLVLMVIDTTALKIPVGAIMHQGQIARGIRISDGKKQLNGEYAAIMERNLFRSKLHAELPRSKTQEEIDEEIFVETLKTFALKGVWVGKDRSDSFAFIDKGPQKGVWIHRNGEQMEGGLTLKEIKPNSVLITKGEKGALLTLFTKGFERIRLASDSSGTVSKKKDTHSKDK